MTHCCRQQSEQAFFDELYRHGWTHQDERIDEKVVPPNMLVYWRLVRHHLTGLKQRVAEPKALDCGCGYGVLSVLAARLGVRVTAVDISPNSIAIVERLAAANGVSQNVKTVVAGLEDLPFDADTFDCVLGTRILHHVEVATAGSRLARVLKTGGKAVFWECTEKNPILRFARKRLRRLLPLPKYGTAHEHPITEQELCILGKEFGTPPEIVAAPFYFFTLADQYIFRQKLRWLTKLMAGMDSFIAGRLPVLNHFSFHQVLVFEKKHQGAESNL